MSQRTESNLPSDMADTCGERLFTPEISELAVLPFSTEANHPRLYHAVVRGNPELTLKALARWLGGEEFYDVGV